MAIAADILFEEAKCYMCLGISQAEALELALLNRIASGTGSAAGPQFYFLNIQGGWPAGLMNDGLQYYFMGNNPFDLRTLVYDFASIEIPTDGTITEWYLKAFWTSTVDATVVPHTLSINGAVDVSTISFAYNNGASFTAEGRSATLSHAVTKGQDVAMRVTTPAVWNNPVGIRYYGLIKIQTS
jgi:hypothetical protein